MAIDPPWRLDPFQRIVAIRVKKRYRWTFQYVISQWGVFITPDGNFLSAGSSLPVAMDTSFIQVTTTTTDMPPIPPPPPLADFAGTDIFTLNGKPGNQATGRPSGQGASIANASGGGSNDVHMDFSGLFAKSAAAPEITWHNTSLVQAPGFISGIGVIAGKSMMSPDKGSGPIPL